MKLKQYLKDQNIPIYHLSRQIGIPRTTLEDIVNGRTKLSECRYSTLVKIADFLQISVDGLVESDGISFYPFVPVGEKLRQLAKNNRQGHTGVCQSAHSGDFRAYIKLPDRNLDLGRYKTLEEAVAARKAAEKVLSNLT